MTGQGQSRRPDWPVPAEFGTFSLPGNIPPSRKGKRKTVMLVLGLNGLGLRYQGLDLDLGLGG